LLIDTRINELNRISSNLALLISVDGLQESHDFLRGKGTFNRVIDQIRHLLSLQRNGVYKGLVSVNCVICDATAPHLYHSMEFFETLGVDSVYFNFPWYISPIAAGQMDDFVSLNFTWLPALDAPASWQGYTHFLSPSLLDVLHTQIERLTSRTWNVRVRFQPPLNDGEIDGFIAGKTDAVAGKSECLAIRNRMEVLADGTVSACKFFPEFAVGNLNSQRPLDVWHGEKFKKFRCVIDGGLMPVCSKCVTLYLNGK
jgi:radical SAM protein with 4Fe4S-binding SPASM domain